MAVRLFTTLTELEAIAEPWRALDGGVPMRGPDWLIGWARHYGADSERLFVPSVWRGDRLIGLAPWRLDRTLTAGRAVRWLGDGEACTDHLTVLADEGVHDLVVSELADWLVDEFAEWDLLDLDHSDADDHTLAALLDALAARGCATQSRQDDACWTIDLPSDWDEFLASQSKSHRKQLRRAERRVLESDACTWRLVETRDELEQAWPILVDLHQRRRRSLGETGCFASPAFESFHRELAPALLERGQLRVSWVELEGRPIAAEHHFAGGGSIYAYQGGVDPEGLEDEPGRISNIATLKHAIEEGREWFDFLRGDEPYKAHWRAVARPTLRLLAVAPRKAARLRAGAGAAADSVRGALKTSLRRLRDR